MSGHGCVCFEDTDRRRLTLNAARHRGTTTRLAHVTAAEPMTADTPLRVEALVDAAGDSIRVDVVEHAWLG
jgi:hypothetical protein